MKSSLRSTNVQDKSRETSHKAPHRNPDTNPFLQRFLSDDAKAYQKAGDKVIKKTMADKGNPFRDALKGMDKSAIKFRASQKAEKAARKIPIPTPRPDNSKPLPKVFRDNSKG